MNLAENKEPSVTIDEGATDRRSMADNMPPLFWAGEYFGDDIRFTAQDIMNIGFGHWTYAADLS